MEALLFFTVVGYVWGSILPAPVLGKVIYKRDIIAESKDGNPGSANVFMNGGLLGGMLTLLFDLSKGFFPVWCCLHVNHGIEKLPISFALVLAAPVIGHVFSVFHRWKGGKGIATTFGCLLGLLPEWRPILVFVFFFLFFSLIVRVTPHSDRTCWSYAATMISAIVLHVPGAVIFGFVLITLSVFVRLKLSHEDKEKRKVRLLWMH